METVVVRGMLRIPAHIDGNLLKHLRARMTMRFIQPVLSCVFRACELVCVRASADVCDGVPETRYT